MIYSILKPFSVYLVLLIINFFPNYLVSSYDYDSGYDSTIISWSGYDWRVKEGYRSPGPNHFTVDAVQLTNENKTLSLILKPMEDGNWTNGEIYSTLSLGYGTYTWIISTETAALPAQVTLGMFTWEDRSADVNSREIDIELAKWGNSSDPRNIQFTVQPHTVPGNAQRFQLSPSNGQTKAEFTWSPCGVSFRTYKYDLVNNSSEQFITHTDTVNHVLSDNEKVHINLWLWASEQPDTQGRPVKVDIESFTFTPLTETDAKYIVGNETIIFPLLPYIKSHVTQFNSPFMKELATIFDFVQKFVLDKTCT